MKREIKFRFWDTTGKEPKMLTWSHFAIQVSRIQDVFINASEVFVMQSTGFLDKTGKEIYESDLLRDGSVEYPYIYEVYWDDKYQWSTRRFDTKTFSGSLSNNKYIIPEEMKVIIVGNIYEPPTFK